MNNISYLTVGKEKVMKHSILSCLLYAYCILTFLGLQIYLCVSNSVIVGLYVSLLVFTIIIFIVALIADIKYMKDKTYLNNNLVIKIYSTNRKPYNEKILILNRTGQESAYLCFNNRGGTVSAFYEYHYVVSLVVNDINWLNNEDKLQYITQIHRYSMSQRDQIIIFLNKDYQTILFDYKGNPLTIYANQQIKTLNIPCICQTLNNIEFKSWEQLYLFKNYLCYLLATQQLNVVKNGKYSCPKCKTKWRLIDPSQTSTSSTCSTYGSWVKIN